MGQFIISEEEKRRILKMHVESTKRHYGLIKEQQEDMELVGEITVNFNPADYRIDQILENGKQELDGLIVKIKSELKSKKNKIPFIKLNAGESLITPPKQFPNRGDLSDARMESVINYLKNNGIDAKFEKTYETGKEPYSGPQDLNNPDKMKKYREEQFFTVTAYLIPIYEIFIFNFYIIKDKNGNDNQYARWVTRDGQNSILNKTDYEYLRNYLSPDKYYTPTYFWSIIKDNLGSKNNLGGGGGSTWEKIKQLSNNSYYQVIFEEGSVDRVNNLINSNSLKQPRIIQISQQEINNKIVRG